MDKELEEEKRALAVITDQIESAMYAHGRSYSNNNQEDGKNE